MDVPRTHPDVPLFSLAPVHRVRALRVPSGLPAAQLVTPAPVTRCVQSLERILYVWGVRHPATRYVQGMNDLASPIYVAFLSGYVGACRQGGGGE